MISMSELADRDPRISEFLDKAFAAGISTETLVGLLTSQGWREKDVYLALGTHLRDALGLEIPRRSGSGATAKDAFYYLLIFSTLATWTISLGSLAFQLIERWLADPLFSPFQQEIETYELTWSLAAILIAFPLYLLISRSVLREAAADPEKLDSGIRKWLTYLALVVAACIFMGDLICALAFLLRGEVTSRFLAKAFVVLALSGGVFYYYFGGLRRNVVAETGVVSTSRDRWMAGLSSAVVLTMLTLGFVQLGPPHAQRELRADTERVQQLYQLASQIQTYWHAHASHLPASIDGLPASRVDPLTGAHYEFHPAQGSQYELCATFARDSRVAEGIPGQNQEVWNHPAGRYCFSLDANAQLPYPMQYLPN
jgi:hypothetical protein